MTFCEEHSHHEGRLDRMERDMESHRKKMDQMSTKLNLILGAVLLSPFLVTAFTLLLRAK